MAYLLLPEDELVFVTHLVDNEGLALLRSDEFREEELPPSAAREDLRQLLPTPLPAPRRPLEEPVEPHSLLFWASEVGPLRRMSEAPPAVTAPDRVARKLLADTGVEVEEVVDYERSPILRFSRCRWHQTGALHPGLWQGPPAPISRWLPEIRTLHRRVDRWLKHSGTRIDPFACAPDGVEPPASEHALRRFTIWAHPRAAEWVSAGGRVWPWSA